VFPTLYAILDVDTVSARGLDPRIVAADWIVSGVRLIQLRAKNLPGGEFLRLANDLVALAHAGDAEKKPGAEISILINDRADIALLSGADGVHVGQDDLKPSEIKKFVSRSVSADSPRLKPWPSLVGLSTHNLDQLRAGLDEPADYFAIGPVFETRSKANADPVVGIEGVRAARALLDDMNDPRPLVAIGGITPATAPEILKAGAASVAVISALFAYRISTFLPEAF
jgi:thiamine-phosphate pyrophosphorylase